MKRSNFLIASAVAITLVYLFVTAPPPLEASTRSGKTVPVSTMFEMVAAENDAVRTLYTAEIVGAGKKVGFGFGEDWKEDGVHKGPLPALFLREASARLERSPVELGLYLGSDYPINSANKFTGEPAEMFAEMKEDRVPRYFFDEDTQRETAMFVDIAGAAACVSCHNDHKDTPKDDWVLGDVMGATTWTYPRSEVTTEEVVEVLAEVRRAFRETYESYLDKAAAFPGDPLLGESWPRDGEFVLPDSSVFMNEQAERASQRTVDLLLSTQTSVNP